MPSAKVDNKRVSVSLRPDQIEWLQEQRGGISARLRALITEAMEMENLQKAAQQIRAKKSAAAASRVAALAKTAPKPGKAKRKR